MEILWSWNKFTDVSGEEMHELLSLRQQVFVVEQNCAFLDADDLDKQSWHLFGRSSEGKLVAYARLSFPNTKYTEPSFGRVVTSKEIRGTGVGQQLVTACIQKSTQEYPGLGLRISAQAYLTQFYERFGLVPVGDIYLDDGIDHIDMVLSVSA